MLTQNLHEKKLLPMLKHQIFHFWSKFDSLTQLSQQKIKAWKIQPCHLLVFMAKCSHIKNQENPLTSTWEKHFTVRCMHRRMDGKTEKRDQFYRIHFSRARVPIKNLQGDHVARTFYKQELQKTKQAVFRIEKILKRKGNKLFVK